MTTVNITRLDENNPAALFCHYPSQHRIQDCYLALDLEDGELSADYNGEVGSGIPMSVHLGRTRRFTIPCLTAEAANNLMDHVAPLAQRILDGAEIAWDGNNNVGRLTEDAQAAEEDLAAICNPQDSNWDPSQMVVEWDAADWYTEGADEVLAEYNITADTTDDELGAVAKAEEEKAATCGADGYSVLVGADAWLWDRRKEMRDTVRDELETVAEQIESLTERRNGLIRRLAGWGDSSREIGGYAGMSHTQVQNIVKAGD